MIRRLAPALLALAACAGPYFGTPAVTTLTPPPGPFNDRVTLTFATDLPATIFATFDGTDPTVDSPARVSGPAPLVVPLDRHATVHFFSETADGVREPVRSVQYVRAGGVPGTISGVVVVGSVAVGRGVALARDGDLLELGRPASPVELPFTLTGLDSGSHRLQAFSDRNGDGEYVPFQDFTSDPLTVELDLDDPFQASAEHVRLRLGTSSDGLGTIAGTVTLANPDVGALINIAAMSPDALGQTGDPAALLGQLTNGDRLLGDGTTGRYPYAITELQPGTYVPVPALISFGGGGLGINLLANLFRPVQLSAGETEIVDHRFGAVTLGGTVTFTPPGDVPGFAYGVVAAKAASIGEGLQAVLMPVILTPSEDGTLSGGYVGQGLREYANFSLRVFTNQDEAGANPLIAALTWAVNPLAGEPAMDRVRTGNGEITKDFALPWVPPPPAP